MWGACRVGAQDGAGASGATAESGSKASRGCSAVDFMVSRLSSFNDSPRDLTIFQQELALGWANRWRKLVGHCFGEAWRPDRSMQC